MTGHDEDRDEKATPAAYFFAAEQTRLALFYILMLRYQIFALSGGAKFGEFLREEESESPFASVHGSTKNFLYDLHEKKRWEPFIYEIFFCRLAEAFEKYFKDVLVLIYRDCPDALRSSEKVTIDEVLRHRAMGDFLKTVARDRVERVSFAGFSHLVREFEGLGFKGFFDESDFQKVEKIFHIRNNIVHRNILASGIDPEEIFEKYIIEIEDEFGRFSQLTLYLYDLVNRLDRKVGSKFDITITQEDMSNFVWSEDFKVS